MYGGEHKVIKPQDDTPLVLFTGPTHTCCHLIHDKHARHTAEDIPGAEGLKAVGSCLVVGRLSRGRGAAVRGHCVHPPPWPSPGSLLH